METARDQTDDFPRLLLERALADVKWEMPV